MPRPILYLRKRLEVASQEYSFQQLTDFCQCGVKDSIRWLELRHSAVQPLHPAPGPWSVVDFHREFTAKAWWSDERMMSFCDGSIAENPSLIGSVTVAGVIEPGGIAALHWLLVHPGWQRQGIGRRLVVAAEDLARRLGASEMTVETHRNWTAAVALYESLGYSTAGRRA